VLIQSLQITLMDCGNAIVRSKEVDASGTIVSLTMNLNLDGDFQKTKKKITWLSQPTSDHPLASVALVDFDYLITKKKLQEEDEVADFVTPVSEFKEVAYADANVLELHRGDVIQFERKGYYIYDGEVDGIREFFKIPDGKAAGIASKASLPTSSTTDPITPSVTVPATSPSSTSMYKVDKIYQDAEINLDGTRMYKVENIYKS
jgi:glutamyl-tRNA synthetase